MAFREKNVFVKIYQKLSNVVQILILKRLNAFLQHLSLQILLKTIIVQTLLLMLYRLLDNNVKTSRIKQTEIFKAFKAISL